MNDGIIPLQILSFCQKSDKSNVHITFCEAGKVKGKEDAHEYTCDQNTKQHGMADNYLSIV